MYNDVNEVRMEWNVLGIRIPLGAVLILFAAVVTALAAAEVIRTLTDNAILAYLVTGVPAGVISLTVLVIVFRFSALGPLPIGTQFQLLRSVAREPYWDGLPYDIDDED